MVCLCNLMLFFGTVVVRGAYTPHALLAPHPAYVFVMFDHDVRCRDAAGTQVS
jgi:hypothetical protein